MSPRAGVGDITPPRGGDRLSRSRHHLLLLGLTTLLFLLIEYRHPYYFLQDDNRDQNLPYYVGNFRAVADREFPLFNFHQFLGTPLLACVQSAAFYPVNYLAGWASKLLFGHYFATIDLIAFCHLLLAALGFFQFMRYLKLSPLSSIFGALAWTYCGFVILVGNSWIQFVGFAAYQPWLGLLSLKLLRGFDPRTFAALVVARALQFFLGYPQMFVYSAALELLGIVLYLALAGPERRPNAPGLAADGDGRAPIRQRVSPFLLQYALHYAFVVVVTLPVLLPALHQIGISADRSAPLADEYRVTMYNLTDWVNGLVRPWADTGVDMVFGRNLHVISHVGYLVLLFAGAALMLKKDASTARLVSIFTLLGIASFLLASNATVANALYSVPVFNRFRWLFKFAFFTSFYLVIVATFGLDLFRGKLAESRLRGSKTVPAVLTVLICLQACNALYLYCVVTQKTFGTHLDQVPFDEPLKDRLRSGRIVSVGFEVTDTRNASLLNGYTARTLGFNYATLWDLFQVGGYEILLAKKNAEATLFMNYSSILSVGPEGSLNAEADLPLEYFRLWGVRWYLVNSAVPLEDIGDMQPVFMDDRRTVLFDPAARPFVYPAPGTAGASFRQSFTTNAVEIATASATGGVAVVNVLYNPFFRGSVDGVATPIAETAESQIQIRFPSGSHAIRIVYVDPYFYGGLIAAVLLLSAAGIVIWRWRHRLYPLSRATASRIT